MRLRGLLFVLVGLVLLGLPAGASAEGGCSNEAVREEQHATFLPDCRAYEMVSPLDKNGGAIMRSSERTRASVDGDALKFSSLAAFADAQSTGVATEYLSRRTAGAGTQGWATHAITPPLDATGIKFAAILLDPGYMAFSQDLSAGLFNGPTNLTHDPNVNAVQNFYLRSDLLEAGVGSYQLLSACSFCVSPLPKGGAFTQPHFAAATADLGKFVFEDSANLVEGATGGQYKLYEWDHGTLRIAGILPASEGGEVALEAKAGQGPFLDALNTLSDGSDGHSRVFFTAGAEEALYMRVDGVSTVRVSASERTDCAEHNPCSGTPEPDPAGTQPAVYQVASANGRRVFFLSHEELTDAPGSGLYMYDASKSSSDPHNLTLIASGYEQIEGVLGTSEDGSYVYFMDTEQIVPGAPPLNGETGFFLWHNGTYSYIGSSIEGPGLSLVDSVRHTLGSQFEGEGPRVAPDGKSVIFLAYSGDGLTGYDHGVCSGEPCAEVYLYHAADGKVMCVSCNPSGAPGSAEASFFSNFNNQETGGSLDLEGYRNHPLSDDGRYVFFQTAERLVPDDTNGKADVYEYDSVTGGLHLISSGTSDAESSFLDATPDGKSVFFTTASPLVGWDRDANYDVYDARVGGGFPEPAAAAVACEGEACRGQLGAPAAVASPSSTLEGAGNSSVVAAAKAKPKSKPRVRALVCRRGLVRKKVRGKARCVKQRHAKRAKASGRGK